MAELALSHPHAIRNSVKKGTFTSQAIEWLQLFPLLVMAALLAELFTPYLIWKRILPGAAKWLGDLFILLMIGHTLWRMLRRDRIPTGFLLIVAISIIGSVVAAFEGQQWQATAWGIWLMFKYPMVAIYSYLYTGWQTDFPKRLFYAY